MNNWQIPNNPPPFNKIKFPTFIFIGLFIFINIIILLILKFLINIDFIDVVYNHNGLTAYLLILIFYFFILSTYTLYWEIRNSLYSYWCYWQKEILMQWLASKHEKIYLIQSEIIASHNSLITEFNHQKLPTLENNNNRLITLAHSHIVGDDRFIALFSLLFNKVKSININKNENILIIVNSELELRPFIKQKIALIVKSRLTCYELYFQSKPRYHKQLAKVKQQQSLTAIFSINYYCLKIPEDKEIASLIILSNHQVDDKNVKLFNSIPFSINNLNESVETLTYIQQQKNELITQASFIHINEDTVHNIMLALRSHKKCLFSFKYYAQGYLFEKHVGNYQRLSIYHFLALFNASNVKENSQLLFYILDDQIYCQTIGIHPTQRNQPYQDIPLPPMPLGSLLFSLVMAALLFFNFIYNEIAINIEQIIIGFSVFLFIMLLITRLKKIYINLYLK